MDHRLPLQRIPTGVPGLDALTKGGLPAGRTTLITGKSGAGKSTLCLQVACHLVQHGGSCVYLALEERPEDLRQTAFLLGLADDQTLTAGQLQVIDMRPSVEGTVQITGTFDVQGLISRIGQLVKAHGASMVVLDSVSALFTRHARGDLDLRRQFSHLVHALEQLGVTVMMTTEAADDYVRPTMLGVEDYLCDLVLVLRNVIDGKRRRRTIEVHKYRRSGHKKGEYPYTIAQGGLVIFPVDANAPTSRAASAAPQRFSSGVPGLDRMTEGGWLRNSIVIVRGPSGSGKTTLAGMYARAGASRGEKVVYYGFEETEGMLMRNFAALALPMEEAEGHGNLRIICSYPEATSPEDLLIEIRRSFESFKPSLVVLDSISSIEHSTSAEGFRIFLVGLASLLRESGHSALLVQTTATHSENIQVPPFLSTLADAILMLDYSAGEPALQRTMRVLKMRGSAHDTNQHVFEIRQGGLWVDRALAALPRALSEGAAGANATGAVDV